MLTQWQPIETAPKDGSLIDLWVVPHGDEPIRLPDCKWRDGAWFVWTDYADAWLNVELEGDPTHWMPLPEPPK